MKPDTPKQVKKDIGKTLGIGLVIATLVGIPAYTSIRDYQAQKEERKIEQSALENKALTDRLIQDTQTKLGGTEGYISTKDYQSLLDSMGVEYKLQPNEKIEMASIGGGFSRFFYSRRTRWM